jgi:hypothetical protein
MDRDDMRLKAMKRPRSQDMTTLGLAVATALSAALGIAVSILVWLFESLVHPINQEIEEAAYLLILCGAVSLLVPPVMLRLWFARTVYSSTRRRLISLAVVLPNMLFQAMWVPVSISALFIWHNDVTPSPMNMLFFAIPPAIYFAIHGLIGKLPLKTLRVPLAILVSFGYIPVGLYISTTIRHHLL